MDLKLSSPSYQICVFEQWDLHLSVLIRNREIKEFLSYKLVSASFVKVRCVKS